MEMPFIVALSIYMLPTIMAVWRKHKNVVPIALINIFTGLTVAGWFISLIWAFTSNVREETCAP